jgi:hypothetical protein
MILPGSYANGFAPRDGEPLYPELWRGCVGAWNPGLGPTGLTLRDWSGLGRHGDLTLRTASAAWTTSQYGNSMLFAGSSVAEITSTQGRVVLSQDLGVDRIGISCWLRPTSLTKRGICTSGPQQGIPRFALTLETTGAVTVYRGDDKTSTATLSAGRWSHLFVWSDGSTTSFWVDGRFSNTASQIVTISLQTQFFWGSNYWGAFDGQIADFRVYADRPSDSSISLLSRRVGIAYELAPRRRSSSAVQFNRRRRLLIGASS